MGGRETVGFPGMGGRETVGFPKTHNILSKFNIKI
jgi:hypothetical protein